METTFDLQKFDEDLAGIILIAGTAYSIRNIEKTIESILPDIRHRTFDNLKTANENTKRFTLCVCPIVTKEQVRNYVTERNNLIRRFGGHKICEFIKLPKLTEDIPLLLSDILENEAESQLRNYLEVTKHIRMIKPTCTNMEDKYHSFEITEVDHEIVLRNEIHSRLATFLNTYHNRQLINWDELWSNYLITHQIYYRILAGKEENPTVPATLYCGDDLNQLTPEMDVHTSSNQYLTKQIENTKQGKIPIWYESKIQKYLEHQIKKTTKSADLATVRLNENPYNIQKYFKKSPDIDRDEVTKLVRTVTNLLGFSEHSRTYLAYVLHTILHPGKHAGQILQVTLQRPNHIMDLMVFKTIIRNLVYAYRIDEEKPINVPVWCTAVWIEDRWDDKCNMEEILNFLKNCTPDNCNHIGIYYKENGEMPHRLPLDQDIIPVTLNLNRELTDEKFDIMNTSEFSTELKNWIQDALAQHPDFDFPCS